MYIDCRSVQRVQSDIHVYDCCYLFVCETSVFSSRRVIEYSVIRIKNPWQVAYSIKRLALYSKLPLKRAKRYGDNNWFCQLVAQYPVCGCALTSYFGDFKIPIKLYFSCTFQMPSGWQSYPTVRFCVACEA